MCFFWKDWMKVFSILFLSFQTLVNLHESTSIILNPSCIFKTVKTCHGCSILGLAEKSRPWRSTWIMQSQLVQWTVSTGSAEKNYRHHCHDGWVFATSVLCFPRRLVQVLEYARKHSWLSWSLQSGKRQKRSVRSRRRRWWKRRDSCLVLFLTCRTEWSHHDLFSHGPREHWRLKNRRYASRCSVAFWRMFLNGCLKHDCHQGMVSEPPRDPFSDAKLATQKLFEMDWKCQDGLDILSLLHFTHYVRNIVEKMGSLDTKAQGCSSTIGTAIQNAALNVKQFGCAESFQSKKRGGWKVTFESLQCWKMSTAHFNHASIFNIIQRVRFVFARRKELAQKGDATAKMEVWFQRRGQVRSLLDDDDDDDNDIMGLDDYLINWWLKFIIYIVHIHRMLLRFHYVWTLLQLQRRKDPCCLRESLREPSPKWDLDEKLTGPKGSARQMISWYVLHYSEELCDTSLWFSNKCSPTGVEVMLHMKKPKAQIHANNLFFLCCVNLKWQTYVEIWWTYDVCQWSSLRWNEQKHLNIYQGADSNSKWPRATES